MATPPPGSSTVHPAPLARRGRPLLRRMAWLGVLALVAALVVSGHALVSYARTGSAYGARLGCSCRFVEGRPLGQCRADFEHGMGLVTLSEDAAAHSVTGRFALLFPRTATFQDGAGCQLEPWTRD